MTISDRIFYLLDRNNQTQKQLSEYTGIKCNTISDWKRKGTNPSADKISRICDFFGVSVSWLLTGDEENNSFSSEESELLKYFNLLDREDRIRVLERARTIAELKNEKSTSMPREIAAPKSKVMPMPVQDKKVPAKKAPKVMAKKMSLRASAGLGNFLSSADLYETGSFDADDVPDNFDFAITIAGDSMEPLIYDGDIVWVKEQDQIDDGEIGIFVLNGEAYCKKLEYDYEERVSYLVSLNEIYDPIPIKEYDVIKTVGKVIL